LKEETLLFPLMKTNYGCNAHKYKKALV